MPEPGAGQQDANPSPETGAQPGQRAGREAIARVTSHKESGRQESWALITRIQERTGSSWDEVPSPTRLQRAMLERGTPRPFPQLPVSRAESQADDGGISSVRHAGRDQRLESEGEEAPDRRGAGAGKRLLRPVWLRPVWLRPRRALHVP